ncbi:MAG: hypothetical protein M3512_07180 [Bacteroidota bacterium]|nr:hypothetical protein [Bacteroidota bacterium]
MNIYFDNIEHNGRPRIQIIYERYADQKRFMGRGLFPDKSKQFEVIEILKNLEKFKSIDSIGETLVLFASFEPLAKEEANRLIPQKKIDELLKKINNPATWVIWRSFSTATFFFYSKEQVEAAKRTVVDDLTNAYFDLIKQYDEFDFLKRDSFSIYLDDKKTFDTVYQSNWFYYSKDH